MMMCGAEGVGKSAMAVRFAKGYFQEQCSKAPVERYMKSVQVCDGFRSLVSRSFIPSL